MDPLGAERLDSERGRDRRVDPSRDPDDDFAEAVLVHVVGEPELEPEAHLLELVEAWRDGRLDGLARAAGRTDVDDRHLGNLAAVAGKRAAADVPQPAPDGVGGLDVGYEERLLEARSAREEAALSVEDERIAVEEQLVLPADRVAESDEAGVVTGPGCKHLLPLAVAKEMEGRSREVHEQLRAGEGELGCGRTRLPHVLADRRSDERASVFEQHQVAARREVAILVEDSVVRQEALAVNRLDLAGR